MTKSVPQIDTILSNLASIADTCSTVSDAAVVVARSPDTSPEMAAACKDLDRAIRHKFDIGSYIMKYSHRHGT